jgi:hypothetical protein
MRILLTIWLCLGLAGVGVAQQAPAPQTPPAQQEPNSPKEEPPAQPEPAEGQETDGAKEQKPAEEKAEPEKADSAKEAPQEAEKKEAEEKPERVPSVLVEGGWADWGLGGAERKFRQYATPPRGWFLRDLRYMSLFTPRKQDLFLTLKGLGQDDYRAETSLAYQYGDTMLRGATARNRFFDPTPVVVPYSQWREDQVVFRQALFRDIALSYRYRRDAENWNFEPPRAGLNQEARYWDLLAAGRLGRGYASLGYVNWRFADHTGQYPALVTQGLNASYLWELSGSADLEAAYSRLWLDQPGLGTNTVDTLAFTGDFALGSATDLDVSFRLRHLDLPIVRNALVREQRATAARIEHRWRGWGVKFGVRYQEAERLRGDQTYVDVPRWWTVEGSLSGRLSRYLRMTLRGYTQSLVNGPVMVTDDPRPLYWDQRDWLQLKLDGGTPDASGYLIYTYRQLSNGARASDLTTHILTTGGTWQITAPFSVFAEYTHEFWSGNNGNPDQPDLDSFAPDSSIAVIGLNWALSPRAFLSVSYTDFSTDNDNPLLLREGNTHGKFWMLNGRYQFPNGTELGLVVAPWAFRDQVVGAQDYDATVVMLTAGLKF